MAGQRELDWTKPIRDPQEIGPTIRNNPQGRNLRRRAERWIAENPQIYAMFVRFALDLAAKRQSFGIGLLAERVRWECKIQARSDAEYRVNNNHRAYIARRLVQDHPELESLLRFRETRY